MSHITIKLKTGQETVWPVARVHLTHTPYEEGPTGHPEKWELVSPEIVLYEISKEEYKKVQQILTNPMRLINECPPCEMHSPGHSMPTGIEDFNKIPLVGCAPLGNPDEPVDKPVIIEGDIVEFDDKDELYAMIYTEAHVLKVHDDTNLYAVEYMDEGGQTVKREVPQYVVTFKRRPEPTPEEAVETLRKELLSPKEAEELLTNGFADEKKPKLMKEGTFERDVQYDALEPYELMRELFGPMMLNAMAKTGCGYLRKGYLYYCDDEGEYWSRKQKKETLPDEAPYTEEGTEDTVCPFKVNDLVELTRKWEIRPKGWQSFVNDIISKDKVKLASGDHIAISYLKLVTPEVPEHMKKIMKDAEVTHDVANRKPGRDHRKLTGKELVALTSEEMADMTIRHDYKEKDYGSVYFSRGHFWVKPPSRKRK